MKRLTFLFGLLGAAVGCVLFSQVPTATRENMSAWLWLHVDEKGVHRTGVGHEIGPPYESLTEPGVIKPKSGYCPLDGSKGEPHGYLIKSPAELVAWANYLVAAATGESAEPINVSLAHSLRCPHCGMLFTETDAK